MFVTAGQTVVAKVLDVDTDKQRISLSLKVSDTGVSAEAKRFLSGFFKQRVRFLFLFLLRLYLSDLFRLL